MFPSKHFLKQGLQFGPWKVSRKVLLFIIAFSLVILAFGTLMLETHAFEMDSDDRDDDDSYERDDDWDDDWELSGGDVTMIIVMCLAGTAIFVSLFACCFAEINPPSQFSNGGSEGTNGGGQVFTIQLTKPSIGPQTSLNNQFYQYHQQQHQRHQQQFQQQQRDNQAGNATTERRNGSTQSRAERYGSATSTNARAPYTSSRSPPPPYTQSDNSSSVPPSNTSQEKPPPYSP